MSLRSAATSLFGELEAEAEAEVDSRPFSWMIKLSSI